jgi:tetratricopeptide (TPR) repeat protein
MKFIVFVLFVFSFSFGDELRDLTSKGISAFKKNDYEKALEYFNEAAQKYPTSSEAKFNKGLTLGASGNAKEAEALLSSVKFDKDDKNAEVFYARARIAEAVGDALASNQQQPNFAQAKKAYQTARSLYAQSLDLKKDKRTINNIELLSQKIKKLPEQEEQNQDNQENKDDNKDKQDKQDNQENKDNQDKNDNQDEKDGEQNEQEQNEQEQNEQNEQNEEDKQQEQNQEEQNEEKVQDAMRLLEHYADDAKELNKPPLQKAVPPANGKDW